MQFPRMKRSLRVSIRSVFVLATVLCILLGGKVRQVMKQRVAMAWVYCHEGVVYFDYEVDESGNSIPNAKPPGPEWLHNLVGIDYFIKPNTIALSGEGVMVDLSPLADLTSLRQLFVKDGKITDLTPLTDITRLKSLGLECHDVRDLSPLAKLEHLRTLVLSTSASSEEVAELQRALPDCDLRISSPFKR